MNFSKSIDPMNYFERQPEGQKNLTKEFKFVVGSDKIWGRFLPSDYLNDRLDKIHHVCNTKKELFLVYVILSFYLMEVNW
ncbi:hypothetical protein H5410_022657 [Solanum commersonii]|uniref:Uncharacterized protein n=1 Tax=Solanum commersonii TaxID=4109 RepID=A0A9J5ZHU9_SOLCO|nr:hypothetical protein H5410_022657 [Solanum commersonii]